MAAAHSTSAALQGDRSLPTSHGENRRQSLTIRPVPAELAASSHPSSPTDLDPAVVQSYFEAIGQNNSEQVRGLLSNHRSLAIARARGNYRFDRAVELQAFKCLGAYLGALTGLQLAILLGHTGVALDIIDVSFDQELLDQTFGDRNTTLHLAVLLGDMEATKALLERGANRNTKNAKGFTAVDLANHPDVADLLSSQ
ncbi:hypothetical protein H4R34_002115 [Dimargaris verticillata]|uniref:Ankyrin repeat-containing domain protein n=1 Tax=Dimargaris verticillata TaxID=2761393 RepID=A0A9W8ED62_9FUNG|nr:hypothetical protein H4R34_002115 [Dimargaris verticillata]